MNKFALFALVLAAGSLPPIEQSRFQSLRQIFEESPPSSAPALSGGQVHTVRKWSSPAKSQPINNPHIEESNPDEKPDIQQRARIPQQSQEYRKFQQWRGYL